MTPCALRRRATLRDPRRTAFVLAGELAPPAGSVVAPAHDTLDVFTFSRELLLCIALQRCAPLAMRPQALSAQEAQCASTSYRQTRTNVFASLGLPAFHLAVFTWSLRRQRPFHSYTRDRRSLSLRPGLRPSDIQHRLTRRLSWSRGPLVAHLEHGMCLLGHRTARYLPLTRRSHSAVTPSSPEPLTEASPHSQRGLQLHRICVASACCQCCHCHSRHSARATAPGSALRCPSEPSARSVTRDVPVLRPSLIVIVLTAISAISGGLSASAS